MDCDTKLAIFRRRVGLGDFWEGNVGNIHSLCLMENFPAVNFSQVNVWRELFWGVCPDADARLQHSDRQTQKAEIKIL